MSAGNASLIRQVRSRGVNSEQVLNAMAAVDRKTFVPAPFASRAYEDIALPTSMGQTISQPTVVGWMTQELRLTTSHRVLEIGTGSGYQTLILSYLARYVYSLERFRSLADTARETVIEKHKRKNVSILHMDGGIGLPDAAPFDRIIVTAAAEDVPPKLLDQLKAGGTMVLPINCSATEQRLMRVDKRPSGPEYTELFGVRFVPLLEGVKDE
ncbi:MAG: protein-L-isoaspartate(D-aspartate) O-methyltransferase [Rhodobacteraceae bacterium]|nr:protein-L-isoaspartate(D-aspartate) O-methyltransferase [Paracoccaceae bacterium]